jgi:CBS domain-containing protein
MGCADIVEPLSYEPYDRDAEWDVDAELLDELTEALANARQGATTRPVSVTLPAPLADAFRLLADRGLIDSVSVAATRALEDALQAVIVGLRLDAIYAEHPEARPAEDEIAEMAEHAGVTLP